MSAESVFDQDPTISFASQWMKEVENGANFRSVFEGQNGSRQYARIIERAKSPYVSTEDSWRGVATLVDHVLDGTPAARILERPVIRALYEVQRKANIRALNANALLMTDQRQAARLESQQAKDEILEGISNPMYREFYRSFDQRVIVQEILGVVK